MQTGLPDLFLAPGYDLGLSGAEAACVNKKYHGHCTLPPIMLAKVQQAQINMFAPL